MKLFIIRLILILLFYLIFTYAIKWEAALLAAFVVAWILEPVVVKTLIKP